MAVWFVLNRQAPSRSWFSNGSKLGFEMRGLKLSTNGDYSPSSSDVLLGTTDRYSRLMSLITQIKCCIDRKLIGRFDVQRASGFGFHSFRVSLKAIFHFNRESSSLIAKYKLPAFVSIPRVSHTSILIDHRNRFQQRWATCCVENALKRVVSRPSGVDIGRQNLKRPIPRPQGPEAGNRIVPRRGAIIVSAMH